MKIVKWEHAKRYIGFSVGRSWEITAQNKLFGGRLNFVGTHCSRLHTHIKSNQPKCLFLLVKLLLQNWVDESHNLTGIHRIHEMRNGERFVNTFSVLYVYSVQTQ